MMQKFEYHLKSLRNHDHLLNNIHKNLVIPQSVVRIAPELYTNMANMVYHLFYLIYNVPHH